MSFFTYDSAPKLLRLILKHMIKNPLAFIIFFLAPIIAAAEANLIQVCLKVIIEKLTTYQVGGESLFALISTPLAIAGASWIVFIVIIRAQNLWQCYVIPNFMAEIRMSALNNTLNNPVSYFTNNLPGSLSQKISELPRTIESILFFLRWKFTATISTIIIALGLLGNISYIFASILFCYVITKLCIAIHFSEDICKLSLIRAQDENLINGTTVDSFANIFNVKVFSAYKQESERINRTQQKELTSHQNLMLRINKTKFYFDLISTLMLFVMVLCSLKWYQSGLVSAGEFVFIFSTSFNIMMAMWQLCESLPDLFKDIGVANQALTLLYTNNQSHSAHSNNAKHHIHKGEIKFSNVVFKYDNMKDKLFDNLNLNIAPGSKIGIVGHSGAGKSTLINLILRLYETDTGNIYIDGIDTKKLSEEALRDSITIVQQNPTLFNRSILDNISYAKPSASMEEVVTAAKLADCHDFIIKLTNKYDSIVGNHGVLLSAGQRQKIAIAQAILKDAPILILDEATSSLDSLTEKKINQALSKLLENKTAIIIAHRLSTLMRLDRILVLNNGKIVEDGTHAQLLALSGHYKKFWETANARKLESKKVGQLQY